MRFMGLCRAIALAAVAGCANDGAVRSEERNEAWGSSRAAMAMEDSAPAMRKQMPMGAARNAAGGGYFKPQGDRQMAYTSSFTLTVRTAEDASGFIKAEAEKLGGYVLNIRSSHLTVKIPVAKADEFVKTVSGAGKMSNFTMSAEDMTDTIADLNVRLDNLKKLRERLAALLNQANRVEDMLKVEKELNRVTTEIERLTAQLQNSRKRVDLVTFNITLRAEAPAQAEAGTLRYFPFLKYGIAATDAGAEKKPLFGLDAPEGFTLAAGPRVGVYTAASADDCLLVMQEWLIPDGGTLDFWGEMISRALGQYHHYTVGKAEKTTLDGAEALLIPAEKDTVAGKHSCFVVIAIERNWFSSDRLRTVEFSGAEKPFAARKAAVLKQIQ